MPKWEVILIDPTETVTVEADSWEDDTDYHWTHFRNDGGHAVQSFQSHFIRSIRSIKCLDTDDPAES